jgi:hypothetical protein
MTNYAHTGRIFDNATRKAIEAQIIIEINGKLYITYSDNVGFYEFNLSFQGESISAYLRVEKDGYESHKRRITLHKADKKIEEIYLQETAQQPKAWRDWTNNPFVVVVGLIATITTATVGVMAFINANDVGSTKVSPKEITNPPTFINGRG